MTYGVCSLANFKRIASSHEKLYNEQERDFCFYVAFYYDLLITHSLINFERTISTLTEAAIERCSGK